MTGTTSWIKENMLVFYAFIFTCHLFGKSTKSLWGRFIIFLYKKYMIMIKALMKKVYAKTPRNNICLIRCDERDFLNPLFMWRKLSTLLPSTSFFLKTSLNSVNNLSQPLTLTMFTKNVGVIVIIKEYLSML